MSTIQVNFSLSQNWPFFWKHFLKWDFSTDTHTHNTMCLFTGKRSSNTTNSLSPCHRKTKVGVLLEEPSQRRTRTNQHLWNLWHSKIPKKRFRSPNTRVPLTSIPTWPPRIMLEIQLGMEVFPSRRRVKVTQMSQRITSHLPLGVMGRIVRILFSPSLSDLWQCCFLLFESMNFTGIHTLHLFLWVELKKSMFSFW